MENGKRHLGMLSKVNIDYEPLCFMNKVFINQTKYKQIV